MQKFRKKPVVISAMQFDGLNGHKVIEWIGASASQGDDPSRLRIFTLEGTHIADIGDWIIRGVKGEHYPIKPDIFAATYDPAWTEETS